MIDVYSIKQSYYIETPTLQCIFILFEEKSDVNLHYSEHLPNQGEEIVKTFRFEHRFYMVVPEIL